MFRIGQEEIEALKNIIETRSMFRINSGLQESKKVEETLKTMMGCEYPIFMTSGQAALTSALVGLGTLVGLWTRLAALGGALISLSLWLTVSWAADPYYYGNDLPYLMAWIPLVLAGAPVLSVDAALRGRRRRRTRADR